MCVYYRTERNRIDRKTGIFGTISDSPYFLILIIAIIFKFFNQLKNDFLTIRVMKKKNRSNPIPVYKAHGFR